jgi:hypothetical protein
MTDKRGRGRPPKTENDPNKIIKKIEQEIQTFSAECADKLPKYYDIISQTALNPKSPLKDRIAAAKYCIEHAVTYMESVEDDESTFPEGKPAEETTKKRVSSSVISIV